VDEISLTLPADDAFYRVAHLVVGGFAARRELTFENLEDIELALDTLLERCTSNEEVTVRIALEDSQLRATVGPCAADILRDLERRVGDDLDLRRILEAVSDRIEVEDGHVVLTKRVDTTE
jgi:hypothetical protein